MYQTIHLLVYPGVPFLTLSCQTDSLEKELLADISDSRFKAGFVQ